MAVSFVAATSGGTADSVVNTSVTASAASTTVGDVLLLWLNLTNGTATAPVTTAPAGWTLLGFTVDGAAPQLWAGLYVHVVVQGENPSPVWSFSTGTNAAWAMTAYSGVDNTTPTLFARVDPYLGTSNPKTTEVITTLAPGWVVNGFGDRSGGLYSAETNTRRAIFRQSVYATPCASVILDSNGDRTAGAQQLTITGPAGTSVGSSFILQLQAGSTAPARTYAEPLESWIKNQGPMYVAHRGGSADFVEESAAAYASCDALSVQALEVSAWRTSDGVWVASHDQTTARMFGTSLDIPTSTYAQLSVLRTTVGGYPIARVDALLAAYPTHVWFVDNKSESNISSWLSLIDSQPNHLGRFVIKGAYNSPTWAAARARGYAGWAIYFAATDMAAIAGSYAIWDLLGLDYTASQADWDTIRATGKPVLGHVPVSLANVVTAFSKGAAGVVTGKVLGVIPAYVPPVTPNPGAARGGWWSYYSILQEARADAAAEASTPPVACPNDGEPLSSGPNGQLYCKFDGWPDYGVHY